MLKHPKSRWEKIFTLQFLAIIVIGVGSLFSALGYFTLLDEEKHFHLITSFQSAAPWIALLGGILISVLIAAMLHLTYESKEREKLIKILDENFKQEIAEKIQAEESKQHLEKALLQGQKLQAIGTLAGGIAHDFNNMIYAIRGYVELAQEEVPKNSITYQNLGKVLEGCRRGQELISRILAFSRRQHHEFHPLPLKTTIESALSLLKPTIPASVTLNFLTSPGNYMIMGNETQIHQVIVNIINNAVDAMDGEGTITIQLAHLSKDSSLRKEFPEILHKNYCKIDLSDTGHGMDQNTKERIFEPFFTTKEVGKGTGLGLSTVHGIIDEHKGKISVRSQLGHGTTFTILLPCSDQEGGNPSPASEGHW
jgi:signal transduction histidine kinase